MWSLSRLGRGFYRIGYLGGGLRWGLLRRIAERPATVDELADDLGEGMPVADGMRSALASWLDLGVALGELRVADGRYQVCSRLALALLRPDRDDLAAIVEEYATVYGDMLSSVPRRLATGERYTMADLDARLITRSSRISAPFIEEAINAVVPAAGPMRLLEVGCGSGAFIASAHRRNPDLTAIGLELQAEAAEAARENLAAWGLAGFAGAPVVVELGDVRERASEPAFDLVTLHQNVYYFPESERVALFAHLREFLVPGGLLLVTSATRPGGPEVSGLDLWCATADGFDRLPDAEQTCEQLRMAGFGQVRSDRLGPAGALTAFVARR